MLLVAFILGYLLRYFIGNKWKLRVGELEAENASLNGRLNAMSRDLDECRNSKLNVSAPVAVAPPVVAAVAATATRTKDDLKIVEGIGPAIEKLLNADGIMTFEQLSQASYDRLKNILNNAGERFRIHDPATWPQQAELAHRGDKVALQKLQDELKGGRAV